MGMGWRSATCGGVSNTYQKVTVSWDATPGATYYEYERVRQEGPITCQDLVDYGHPWQRVKKTSVTFDASDAVTVCVRAVRDENGDGHNLETGPFAYVNVTPIGG